MQNRKRDTDVQNRLWDSVGEGEGGMFWGNSIETSILSRVEQTTSPGWMHETSAQGWCTGKTQRDGMQREVGGGIGMGKCVNPWLIHVNVWQKPLQYCKVISLQWIKINGKKKKKESACQCRRQKRHEFYPWVGKMPWNRKWQPTSVFLPGIFHGQRYLEGYHSRGCKESETNEHIYTQGVSRAVENQGMDSDRPLSFSSYWLWPSDLSSLCLCLLT